MASRRSSVTPVTVFSQLAGLIALLLALPLLPPATATGSDFAWGALGGGALGTGIMFLYQGLAEGKMSVVAPVTAVLAVVVSAVVGIGRGERPSGYALAGVALALVAIALIGQDGAHGKTAGATGWARTRGFGAALVAGVLIGVFFVGLKQTSPASGLLPLVSARVASLLVLSAIALARRAPLRVGRGTVWLIVLAGALDIAANVLYLAAARQGMLTIAATVTSLYPGSTILLARVVLGERLHWIQTMGLVGAGLGVVLIGAG